MRALANLHDVPWFANQDWIELRAFGERSMSIDNPVTSFVTRSRNLRAWPHSQNLLKAKFWIACFRDFACKQYRRSRGRKLIAHPPCAKAVAEVIRIRRAEHRRPLSRITESFREFVAKHQRSKVCRPTTDEGYFKAVALGARQATAAVATISPLSKRHR